MAWQMPPAGQWPGAMPMPQDMNMVNMGSYTPEQWTALQQQNWHQWNQWQQQYSQWQQQYGPKYNQQAVQAMPPLPSGGGPPPAPPPPEQPPPPPPHENNQPLYNNVNKSQTNSRTPSNLTNIKSVPGNDQWSRSTDSSNQQSAGNVDALNKLAEEEKQFDIQFQKWEEEIEKWRKENVNHPDKQAYKEYEQKFESCRTQLLERRKQMKMKRARLLNSTPAMDNNIDKTTTGNAPLPVPPVNTPNMQSQHQPQHHVNQKAGPYNKDINKNIDPQDRLESYQDNMSNANNTNVNISNESSDPSTFLPTSANSSSKGIPGLDLVPDSTHGNKNQEVIDITGENVPQAPDYSTISKGINNILGDEKIMNILSMVQGQNLNVSQNHPINAPPPNSFNIQNYPPNQGGNRNANNLGQNQQPGNRSNMPYNMQGPNYPMQQNQGGNSHNMQQRENFNNVPNMQQDPYFNRNMPNNRGQTGPGDFDYNRQGGNMGPGGQDMGPGGMRQGGPNMRQGGPDSRQGGPNARPGGFGMGQSSNEMRQGGPDMRQGGPNMRQGGPNMRQGFDMRQGGPGMSQGEPGMSQGGPGMSQGGPGMSQGGPQMRQGGPDMRQGGPPMRQGGPDMRPGGPDMRQGGPPMRQGGPDMRPGGPDMRQGGPPMRQGGPDMRQGGPDMRQGGPDMRPGGPDMRPGGPDMRQGGPNIGPGGPPMRQGGPPNMQQGPNIPQGNPNMGPQGNPNMGPQGNPNMPPNYNNGAIPSLMSMNSRPPLQNMSSQQNVNNNFGPERPAPENISNAPPRPKWVEDPLFEPTLVVEYDHKPLRLKARDFIEPVHTFDYNHKSKDDDLRKKKDLYEKEVEQLFVRKPRRDSDRDFERRPPRDDVRYSKDSYSRDFERRAPREDVRDREGYRDSRDDFRDRNRFSSRDEVIERRRFDDRFEDRFEERRREDIREYRRDDRRDERGLDRRDERLDRRDERLDRRDERVDRRDERRDDRYDDRRDERRDDRFEDRDKFTRRDDFRDRDRDRLRDIDDKYNVRRDDSRLNSKSKEIDSRKRALSKESEVSTGSKKSKDNADANSKKTHVVMIDDILEPPGRDMRPDKIVIILRGIPGSGKSYLAKLIRDREAEHGGTARIMSIDDYFMHEGETDEKDPQTGKMVKKPFLKYEYVESLEETYTNSLKRAFKRSLTDGYFSFLIYDSVNDQLKSYADIWNYARQCGFQVYICTMEQDVQTCFKRNIHDRTLEDLEILNARFFPTPAHHIQLDATTLLQSASITEVQMEDVEDDVIMEDVQDEEVESVFTSKWEKMDDATQLARLDGTSKPLRPSQLSIQDYLQLDEWTPNKAKPGKKTVRWADIEERREQEKMRAIGFVVGKTDWNRMTDPTMGSSALTQTKYIERVRRN